MDTVIWPRLADWWASRSKADLGKRIKKLKGILAKIETLPLVSEVEDMLLRGFQAIIVLVMLPVLGLLLYLTVVTSGEGLVLLPKDWFNQILMIFLIAIYTLTGHGVLIAIDKFRRERTTTYRKTLLEDIAKLQARLTTLSK